MNNARSTPVTVAPASSPPSACTPRNLPTTTGTTTALAPGTIISRNAARVEMSTHRAESGFAVPSSSPGISWNCRRTSCTIPCAARPTAVIVLAPMKNGIAPPNNKPITTIGSTRLSPVVPSPTADA